LPLQLLCSFFFSIQAERRTSKTAASSEEVAAATSEHDGEAVVEPDCGGTGVGPKVTNEEQLRELNNLSEKRFTLLSEQLNTVCKQLADLECRSQGTDSEAFSPAASFAPAASMPSRAPSSLKQSRRESNRSVTFDYTESGRSKRSVAFQRGSTAAISEDPENGSEGSEGSETWDGKRPSPRSEPLPGTGYGAVQASAKLRDRTRSELKRATLQKQGEIAQQLSTEIRCLGVALAFITIVFLWELTDLFMAKMFLEDGVRLVSYLALSLVAAVCLLLSHHWVFNATSSLVPSFAYALSTLYLAIGSWGVIATAVAVLVPKKNHIVCYAIGGIITLFCTVMYGMQTRHNVLLDIASCATTMGLHDESDIHGSIV